MAYKTSLFVICMLLGVDAKFFPHVSKAPLSQQELFQLEKPVHRHHRHNHMNLMTDVDNMMGSRSRSNQGHQLSADSFDFHTSYDQFSEQERDIAQIKNSQKEFLRKQNAFQKETLERIDKDHEQLNKELNETHEFQMKRDLEMKRQEQLEKEMKEQKEEKTVNELFKSIVNEETNKRKELDEYLTVPTKETVAAPKAVAHKSIAPQAAAPKAVAPKAVAPRAIAPKAIAPKAVAPKAVAPRATQPVAPQNATSPAAYFARKATQLQGSHQIWQMDKTKPKSLVQKSSHDNEESDDESDPVASADLSRFDTDVTYDDSLLMRSSKPTDNSLAHLEEEGDDIDEDALAEKKNPTYEEQAASLLSTDFQMNLDDLN